MTFINLPRINYLLIHKINLNTFRSDNMGNRIFNQNARTALDQLKLEIANELDAKITDAEATGHFAQCF